MKLRLYPLIKPAAKGRSALRALAPLLSCNALAPLLSCNALAPLLSCS